MAADKTLSSHEEGKRIGGVVDAGTREDIGRSLLWQRVHAALRDAILSGRLKAGERIVELETAHELNVSQSTVREALKQLAHQGLVLQLPRRGSYVAAIDEAEARHAYRLRAALERFATAEYCLFAPESAIDTLEADLAAMRRAASDNDTAGFVEADIAFHRHVWEATGNPLLPRMWAIVETSMRTLTAISNDVYFPSLDDVMRTHEPLLGALRHRDAATASELFAHHVMTVWEEIDKAARTSDG
jgi:DNA-binding GntR family transcriptional regulator